MNNVFEFRNELISEYSSFSRSFSAVAAEDLRNKVESEYSRGRYWPEPLIQINPNYKRQGTVQQLAQEGMLHPHCADIFRTGKTEGNPADLHLYVHQLQALAKAQNHQSYVVTTGTGSGKSLAFFVPIIDRILKARATDPQKRTRAIVIYPMNALANSQLEELDKFLHGYPEGQAPFTVARYTGQESGTERLEIASNPPDILLTNFMMLELILTRFESVDRQVVEHCQALEFLVLDELHTLQAPGSLHAEQCAAAQAACKTAQVLHWPLAFAQVFAAGGFDCVLGNPPRERIKLQEEEFFASRHPAVAAAKNKAERSRFITALSQGGLAQLLAGAEHAPAPVESAAEQRLYAEFITARRTAEAASVFMHVDGADGGSYPLTGVGDVNTYALFAETMLHLAAEQGRAGFIVPTGIATDDSTKAYFGYITQNRRLVSLHDFRTGPGLFSEIGHQRFKFALLTIGEAEMTDFLFFALSVAELSEKRKHFTLTPAEFRLINPNTLTCPVFRSERDAELTKKLYRAAPVLLRDAVWEGEGKNARLVRPAENPWGISFQRMLDMANDSHLFENTAAPDRLPLYEAKLIHQFDHRWATYTPAGDSRDLTLAEKQDPAATVTPRYWVAQRAVWLRVARLPKALLQALEARKNELIGLAMTQQLFGHWLAQHPHTGVYPAWQTFVQRHPFAAQFAPTQLGLCGNNPASFEPLNGDYLPAEQDVQAFMSSARSSTAWYGVDPHALQALLQASAATRHLPTPAALHTEDDVLALAEQWLEVSCPQWLMGWRDICRATDERTVIASVMPLVGVGHTMPLFFTGHRGPKAAALLGNFCSLVLDFCARVKVGGTHLTYGYLKQFPVLPPDRYTEADLAYIVPRVLELTYTAHDLAGWAQDLGHSGPPFAFHPERRAQLRAELDAHYARLYGLTRDELRYILDPADVMGEDYPSETFRVLKNKELRDLGEYRTQRLVLAAWDAGA